MEKNTILHDIRRALEEAGVQTSGRSPFIAWVHPDWEDEDSAAGWDGTRLYVPDIPVPDVAPVDIAEIYMHANDQGVYLAFTLYFYTVLKDAMEVEDFRRIHDTHEIEWFPKLREYYIDLSSRFSLEWDVEYDVSIEDTLYRTFEVGDIEEIITVVKSICSIV